jgi:hypothetical protein
MAESLHVCRQFVIGRRTSILNFVYLNFNVSECHMLARLAYTNDDFRYFRSGPLRISRMSDSKHQTHAVRHTQYRKVCFLIHRGILSRPPIALVTCKVDDFFLQRVYRPYTEKAV